MSEISSIPAWAVPLLAALIALAAIVYALISNWVRLKRAEANLLQLCNGDRQMLERLIAFEQDRTLGQSREEAAKAAAFAIRRDNH